MIFNGGIYKMSRTEYVAYVKNQYYNILHPYRTLLVDGISSISNGFIDVWEQLGVAIGLSLEEVEWIVECVISGEISILEIWLNKKKAE